MRKKNKKSKKITQKNITEKNNRLELFDPESIQMSIHNPDKVLICVSKNQDLLKLYFGGYPIAYISDCKFISEEQTFSICNTALEVYDFTMTGHSVLNESTVFIGTLDGLMEYHLEIQKLIKLSESN